MTEHSWVASDDRLSVGTPKGTIVPMEKPIEMLLDLGSQAVILLTENTNVNVLMLNDNGRLLWRIKEYPLAKAWYTSAWMVGANLVLYNASGFTLTLDPSSGSFISTEQMR